MTSFSWGVVSDVGRVRAVNQDDALARDGLFAVADGMGGHRGGEVASQIAVEVLGASQIVSAGDLIAAVNTVNDAIMRRADEDDLAGMGTTLCALALVTTDEGESRLAISNVGDSRVYTFVGDRLQQLTDDHSLVAQLVRDGNITADEAERHPQRNVLTRALGIEPGIPIDTWEVHPVAGDRYLLCSDGLTNELTDDQIAAVLRRLADPKDAASELVRLANASGGRDNVTVVVVNVGDVTTAPSSPVGTVITKRPVVDIAGFAGPLGSPTDGAPPAREPPEARHAEREIREQRPPIVSVRALLFVAALVLVFLVAGGAITWISRHTYFVTFDENDAVAIYQGRPGGVLWIDPKKKQVSELTRNVLPSAKVTEVQDGVDANSLNEALGFVESLRQDIKRVEIVVGTTSTTGTSTTLAPATSATPPTAPATSSPPAVPAFSTGPTR